MLHKKIWLTANAGVALAVFAQFAATTAPLAVQAKPVPAPSALKKLTVSVTPGSIAKTVTVKIMPATANDPSGPPFMNGEPEHINVQFDNDKVSESTGVGDRQLVVYPLADYGKLFKGKEKKEFDKTVWDLQTIISKKSDGGMKDLPVLPAIEAYQVFHTHVKHLLFKQGKGVAYVTCYAQDESPINNGDFFYTYQGITDDLKYYVSLFVPVKAKGFPKDCAAKKAKSILSGIPASNFTPDLEQIDKVVQSISIK
jgi:hypothetical protein